MNVGGEKWKVGDEKEEGESENEDGVGGRACRVGGSRLGSTAGAQCAACVTRSPAARLCGPWQPSEGFGDPKGRGSADVIGQDACPPRTGVRAREVFGDRMRPGLRADALGDAAKPATGGEAPPASLTEQLAAHNSAGTSCAVAAQQPRRRAR